MNSGGGCLLCPCVILHLLRLRNRTTTYGTKEPSKWGARSRTRSILFGGHINFVGMEPLKVFSWLRKFTKACDVYCVSDGMALYVVPRFLSGIAGTQYARALPDSASTMGRCSFAT